MDLKEVGNFLVRLFKSLVSPFCMSLEDWELHLSDPTNEMLSGELMELPVLMTAFALLFIIGISFGWGIIYIFELRSQIKGSRHHAAVSAIFTKPMEESTYFSQVLRKLASYSSISSVVNSVHQIKPATNGSVSSTQKLLEPFSSNANDPQRSPTLLDNEEARLLTNVTLFKCLSDSVIDSLCGKFTSVELKCGNVLFDINDDDNSLYFVKVGHINIYLQLENGRKHLVKAANPGELVGSVISLVDALMCGKRRFTTISAEAAEESILLKLKFVDIKRVLDGENPSYYNFTHMAMARISRVYFNGVPIFFGLRKELFKCMHDNQSESYQDTGLDVNDTLKYQAIQLFKTFLGLQNDILLQNKIQVKTFSQDEFIITENNSLPCQVGLLLVLKGVLKTTKRILSCGDETLFYVYDGEFLGTTPLLSSDSSVYGIKAKCRAIVATLPMKSLEHIIKISAVAHTNLLKTFVHRLSQFVCDIDYGVDWLSVESGCVIYRQNDLDNSSYIILYGLLRSYVTNFSGKKAVLSDCGKGQCIGMEELFSKSKRRSTVFALKHTELFRIPSSIMDIIKFRYPNVLENVIKKLGERLTTPSITSHDSEDLNIQPKYSSVCIFPNAYNIPLYLFSVVLKHSLQMYGTVTVITSEYVKSVLGESIFEENFSYQLNNYIAILEAKNNFVLFQCDGSWTTWSRKCVEKANIILCVGFGNAEARVSRLEKQVAKMSPYIRKDLVLLHEEGNTPKNTALWLKARPWLSCHHHLQCPIGMFIIGNVAVPQQIYEDGYFMSDILEYTKYIHSDFMRIARYIAGTRVGIVLGGGGAKGAAHLGVLQALLEAGIPIDIIGGVSIGSFISALYAKHRDLKKVNSKALEWFETMNEKWRFLLGLGFHLTSLLSGKRFNNLLRDVFETEQFEDNWLPCFALSTDLSCTKSRVHTKGDVWMYVRASMGIVGVLPPICDPKDGHLLVDGIYCDTLGVNAMKDLGADIIFAVDISAELEGNFTNYGDSLTWYWLLWRKVGGIFGAKPVNVPTIFVSQEILTQLAGLQKLELYKNENETHYIRPPVQDYSPLDFGKYDKLVICGLNEGKNYLRDLRDQ